MKSTYLIAAATLALTLGACSNAGDTALDTGGDGAMSSEAGMDSAGMGGMGSSDMSSSGAGAAGMGASPMDTGGMSGSGMGGSGMGASDATTMESGATTQ